MNESNFDEPDELERYLRSLTRFDDICSPRDLQLIDTIIEQATGSSVVQLKLPRVWHGKYRLVRYLGGGMSDVYLAEQINLADRCVVVKILPAEAVAVSKQRLELFLAESQTLAKANRQNAASIVFPIDYDVFEGHPYLVMEYVAGQTLVEYMKNPSDSITEVLDIVTAAARSLAEAHQLDIVHGDIKPANMILRSDRSLQLIDFGLSGFFNEPTRTKFGGTRRYAAPEQLKGGVVDTRSDIYSLGVILRELLLSAGGSDAYETRERMLKKQAEELANQMTAQTPSQRPSSASEVVCRLSKLAKASNRNRRGQIAKIAACIGVIMLAAFGWHGGWSGTNKSLSPLKLEVADTEKDDRIALSTATKRDATLEWIESVKGKYQTDDKGRVYDVNLNNCWIGNGDLPQLNALPHLKWLRLANTDADSEGVAMLVQPLDTLDLKNTETDDRIFEVIKNFPLRTLQLSGTKITGAGLKAFSHPTRLDSIGLSNTSIGDGDAETIAGMTRLRFLELDNTAFTTRGVRSIKHLPLRELSLAKCPIDDKTIAEVAEISSLRILSLHYCRGLTENCIDDLMRMESLEAIGFAECPFSDEQLLRLKALPNLRNLVVNDYSGRNLLQLQKAFGSKIQVH